ncbi:MAG: DNA replication/repair protein RecF [Alphaproteobacteria bacterium]|nr:DNA replication/repair protein RecF [Alphaproteobacteria bacterium]
MRLTSLSVRDWRNLHQAELHTDARFVVLHGDNAQGKTNLLEAVWLLATLRSFRDSRPSRWVRQGAAGAFVRATAVGHTGTRRLEWRLSGRQRSLRLDGGAPSSLADWFEVVRAVLFQPEHVGIIKGGPDERRAWLDRAVFTARPRYLDVARDYRRALRQKAALLRDGRARDAALAPWNARLADLGARVMLGRHQVLTELLEPVREMHTAIAGGSGDAGKVALRMSSLGGEEEGLTAVRERLARALAEAQAEEIRRGRVLVGPHRDDVRIGLEGRSARLYASQGQARTLVLALKLAELVAARARGEAPMLLVDDLTSELDQGRMGRFIEVLSGLDNQVWVTTTDPRWLGPLPDGETVRWRLRGGAVFGETVRPAGESASKPLSAASDPVDPTP